METFSASLALCEGNPPVIGGFLHKKVSYAELWYFNWCEPEQTIEQTVEMLDIWDAMAPIVTSL